MKKKILVAVAAVVLIVGVLLWQVVANLDAIVASVIEEVGSDVLKTEVRVTGVSINLKEGKASIAGMSIANPEGYSSASLFEMEGIEVDIDLASLGSDVLIIESIIIKNPRVSYEGDESGGSNMQTLLNNMESGSADADTSSEGEAMRLIIDQFEFSGARVKATSPLMPGETLDVKVPAIKLFGIGRSQGGVTADVVAKQITSQLAEDIVEAALKSGLNKALEKQKKSFMDKLGSKLKGKG